jgi:hypothetical protein
VFDSSPEGPPVDFILQVGATPYDHRGALRRLTAIQIGRWLSVQFTDAWKKLSLSPPATLRALHDAVDRIVGGGTAAAEP